MQTIDTTTDTTTVSTPRRRAARRTLLAFALALATLVGLGTSQASAYTYESTGTRGGITPYQVVGQQVTTSSNGYLTRLPGIKIQGPYVTRDPSMAGYQIVLHKVDVFQWNYSTRAWVYLGQRLNTRRYDFPVGSGGRYLDTLYLQLGSGTFKVEQTIAWPRGGIYLNYNQRGDYACAIAACNASNGYIVL